MLRTIATITNCSKKWVSNCSLLKKPILKIGLLKKGPYCENYPPHQTMMLLKNNYSSSFLQRVSNISKKSFLHKSTKLVLSFPVHQKLMFLKLALFMQKNISLNFLMEFRCKTRFKVHMLLEMTPKLDQYRSVSHHLASMFKVFTLSVLFLLNGNFRVNLQPTN